MRGQPRFVGVRGTRLSPHILCLQVCALNRMMLLMLIAAITRPGTAQAPSAQTPAAGNQDANREKNLEAGEVEAKQMLV